MKGLGCSNATHWAEYLTVIVTASFLPLEVYEMVQHTTAVKGFVIALNVAIVVYLVLRLKHRHKSGKHSPAKPGAILTRLRPSAR